MSTLRVNAKKRDLCIADAKITDFDDPEVQCRIFEEASLIAFQSGLPVMGAFMQAQANIASLKAGSDQQDKELLELEHYINQD